jgi:hypothetical protein
MTSSHSLRFAELTAHQLQSAYSKAALAVLVALAFFAAISLGGGVYGVLVLGVSFAVFTLSNPQAGLWLSLGLVMIASMIAVPAAFEFGYGYSPELAYWAAATCVVFLALSVGYFRTRMNSTVEPASTYRLLGICGDFRLFSSPRYHTWLSPAGRSQTVLWLLAVLCLFPV